MKAQHCKFCGHIFAKPHPCEYSSYWDDVAGEQVTTYCGNQMCPKCSMCQGNEPTPQMVRAARQIADIRRSR